MPGYKPVDENDVRLRSQHQTLLPADKFEVAALNAGEEGDDSSSSGTDEYDDGPSFFKQVEDANRTGSELTEFKNAIITDKLRRFNGVTLKDAKVENDLLTNNGKLWVPPSMCTKVFEHTHDEPTSGHGGRDRTIQLTSRYYYWPTLREDADRYVSNCNKCLRAKSSRQKPAGLLHQPEVPDQRWKDISCDFITGCPESENMTGILTVVDRLSKERHYIPCRAKEEGTTARQMAWLFIRDVFRLHGLPSSIMSDRGPQFMNKMWRSLLYQLRIDPRTSIPHHAQTDGQTERMNQEIEKGLRLFVNHLQDDWVRWLPVMEFSDNNAISSTTKLSPFYVNKGFHPRMSFSPDDRKCTTSKEKVQVKEATDIATTMDRILQTARANMTHAQESIAAQANKKRQDIEFQIGDEVMVNARNLVTDRPSKKLDHKRLGPFKIIAQYNSSYKLDVPDSFKAYPVFHASDLTRLPGDDKPPMPGQKRTPPEPVIVDNPEMKEWEVEKILDSRYIGRKGRLQYKVAWLDDEPDDTWYYADGSEFEHADELVKSYHSRYPNRPGPELLDPARNPKHATVAELRQKSMVRKLAPYWTIPG